ncbi:MAG TPA: hypothetical protein VF692_12740 [Pyrinomonadaceae bacterium]|jgi:uncharacterized protein YuzE
MRTKFDYELINKTWICKVLGFNVWRNSENLESNVELIIDENGEIKVLRFLNASLIEFESRFSHHGNDLQIVNLTDDGMEYVNLSVSGFIEASGNFSFFASNLIEVENNE